MYRGGAGLVWTKTRPISHYYNPTAWGGYAFAGQKYLSESRTADKPYWIRSTSTSSLYPFSLSPSPPPIYRKQTGQYCSLLHSHTQREGVEVEAEVEVEVISSDTIRPATPTPPHLRCYRLSFLDQIISPTFMHFLLVYPQTTTFSQPHKSNTLKTSLSQTLTKFYPLAGRIVNDLHVDCSDAGVPYTEAQVRCRLSDVISDPSPSSVIKFLPCEFGDVPLAIRVNFFDCGGVVVSMALSHKVADGFALVLFSNCWAAAGRGGDGGVAPSPWLGGAELFPPRAMAGFDPSISIAKYPIVTKRFVFTSSKIASIINKCTGNSSPDVKRPTRIEALSAFVWTRFMASAHSEIQAKKIHTLSHAVNLRKRANPPLPDHYFGNMSQIALAVLPMIDGQLPKCYETVNQVRDAIRKVDEEYVKMLSEGDKHLKTMKEMVEVIDKGEMVSLGFSSLCRFPWYEADFGWGKPVWISIAPRPFGNLVVFMDTHSGDGIEAWVHLKPEDMAIFEVDEELLHFVSPTKGC